MKHATQTAGSEIPIPRESDFTSTTNVLLGIPVASQYRHTLRVYNLDGQRVTPVAIRIYADAETTPRATFEGGVLQLDPAQLGSLAGATTMRIEIDSLPSKACASGPSSA